MKIVWTEAHRGEARRRIFEVAAEVAALDERGSLKVAESMVNAVLWSADSEDHFRDGIAEALGTDGARIDREVRRVHALATGRLVREPPRYVSRFNADAWDHEEPEEDMGADPDLESKREVWGQGGRVVRVVRIRKGGDTVSNSCHDGNHRRCQGRHAPPALRHVIRCACPCHGAAPDAARCPSRWGAYECSLVAGHAGPHDSGGGFTRWPDSADTRETIEAKS